MKLLNLSPIAFGAICICLLSLASSCKIETTRGEDQTRNSETAQETIRETMDESGKLVKIKEINEASNDFSKRIIKYDLHGHELEEVLFFSDGTPAYKVFSRYDSHGNLTQKDFYQADGIPDYVALYRYDANGAKTDLFVAKCKSGSSPAPVWHISLLANGHEVAKELLYTRDNISDLLNNPKTVENMRMYTDSLPSEMKDSLTYLTGKLGQPFPTEISKSDKNGRLIEKFECIPTTIGNNRHTTFRKIKYDEKGREVERSIYHPTRALKSQSVYHYRVDGHEQETTLYNNGSSVVFLTSKYDLNKNVIESSSFIYVFKTGFKKSKTINGTSKVIYTSGM